MTVQTMALTLPAPRSPFRLGKASPGLPAQGASLGCKAGAPVPFRREGGRGDCSIPKMLASGARGCREPVRVRFRHSYFPQLIENIIFNCETRLGNLVGLAEDGHLVRRLPAEKTGSRPPRLLHRNAAQGGLGRLLDLLFTSGIAAPG